MLEAIFQILKDEDSLSLIIESYQLLNELDKVLSKILVFHVLVLDFLIKCSFSSLYLQRYPRVYFSETKESESSSASKIVSEVIVVKRVSSSPV